MKGFVIYSDGGARGNPGPAGAGAVLYRNGEQIGKASKFLGVQTNNWAEYEALILGLKKAKKVYKKTYGEITVRMDSELIVKQMRGEYRVKDKELKKQYEKVQKLIEDNFPEIYFEHVRREDNEEADELANEAMDRGK